MSIASTSWDFITSVRRRVTALDGHDKREYDVNTLIDRHLDWDEDADCHVYDMQSVLGDLDDVTFRAD